MTGEITLHGKVLPIGGLREKTMAAYKAGLKTVIIPMANKPDLDEVDEVVKANVRFVICEDIAQVLETALVLPNCPDKTKLGGSLKKKAVGKKPAEKKQPVLNAN